MEDPTGGAPIPGVDASHIPPKVRGLSQRSCATLQKPPQKGHRSAQVTSDIGPFSDVATAITVAAPLQAAR